MRAGDSSREAGRVGTLSPLVLHGGRALAATALGREAAARRHYGAALRAGASPRALLEIARMAHLLGGFPRAIQGLRALELALEAARGLGARTRSPGATQPRSPGRDGDGASEPRARRIRRGQTLFRRVYGTASDAVLARLDALAPGFATWVVEDAYGRVLSRPGLSPRERELVTITTLAALDCPLQLESHLRGARNVGASASEIAAAIAAARALAGAQTTGSRKSGARQTRRRRKQ